MLRFNDALGLKKPILEKLEDFYVFDDTIAKALLLAFLGILINDQIGEHRKRLAGLRNNISNKGMPVKDILQSLNDIAMKTPLSIPDLKATLESNEDDLTPESLIPAMLGLTSDMLQTKEIRDLVDNWKDIPEEKRKYHAAMRDERERWASKRNPLNDEKKAGGQGFNLSKWKVKVSIRTDCDSSL